MFFRKNNIVVVDFVEPNKESKQGRVDEFSSEGIVVIFDGNDKPTFIPMTSISEVRLVEGAGGSVPTTQF